MSGHNPKKYAKYISRPGVWGTGIELMVISIVYRRSIEVFQKGKGMIAEYFPEFGNPLRLVFSGPATGGHYDALLE